MRIRTLATVAVLLACAASVLAQQVQVAISADGSISDVATETLTKVAPTRTAALVDTDSFILSFPQFEGQGDVSDTVCKSIIPKAEKAYTDRVFDEAAAHMTRCIEMTKKNPSDRAPWAYYFRASARYQAQQVDQAAEDIVEAIRLSPLAPQHWALKAAIAIAKKDLDGAVSDVLHQLALLLDLGDDTTTLHKVCREVPKSFDFRCSFRALEKYIERKLEWSIKEDDQKMRMKLWEEAKLKKALSATHNQAATSRSGARWVANFLGLHLLCLQSRGDH
jgi:tetratricopeptide (TPR) repeat protein